MNLFLKLLKYAWISTGYAWMAAAVAYCAALVFASGEKYRDYDAAAGHIFEIGVGRGDGRRPAYLTHTYFVVYNGLLDIAISCLIVFMLGAVFLVLKPTPKKDRPRGWP